MGRNGLAETAGWKWGWGWMAGWGFVWIIPLWDWELYLVLKCSYPFFLLLDFATLRLCALGGWGWWVVAFASWRRGEDYFLCGGGFFFPCFCFLP